MSTFKLLGTDDSVHTCEACGKRNLKYVVALETEGEVVRYGTDCASVALRYGPKGDRRAADRVWFRALQRDRVKKGIELGLRVRAEIEAAPVTIRDLKRDLAKESVSPGHFCFQAPNGAVVYVPRGWHTRDDGCNERGETLKETALRLYPRALLRARILELGSMLDRGLDEGAAYKALTA